MNLRTGLLLIALLAAGSLVPVSEDGVPFEDGFAGDAVQLGVFRGPLEREIVWYQRDTIHLLVTRDYEGLEQRARVAREEKQRFANGVWKIYQFYTALPLTDTDPDAAWEARLTQIKAWQAAKPSSATAAIALAEVYTGYAGKARGSQPRPEEELGDAPHFRERLEAGLAALEDARSLGERDPHYWRAAHAIAVGLDWPAANLDQLYEQAAALEPHYWSNEIARLSALLAHQGGDPGAIETVAVGAAAAADEYGDEIYARAAWEVNERSGSLLDETPFAWARVQAGYRALLRQHPDSTALLSQYCVLACRARDKAAAQKCFVKLAGKGDLRAFKSAHGYLRHLRWANWN